MRATILLIVATAALAAAIPCAEPSTEANGKALWQAPDCPLDKPYCTWVPPAGGGAPQLQCTECPVGTGQANAPCVCDRSTSYCSQGGPTAGTCQPFTRLNQQCSTDTDCGTRVDMIVDGTTSPPRTVDAINEQLKCLGGGCLACDASTWPSFYAPLGTPYTCPGFNSKASDVLGRYATTYPLPGTRLTCSSFGFVTVQKSTPDYGYGYPGGNYSAWQPSGSNSGGGGGGGGGSGNSTAAALVPVAAAAALAILVL